MKKKVAIIGGGIAGITSAYYLQDKFEVHLFDKNNYLGGHTNSFEIKSGADKGLLIDTGFIVLNDKTYPNIHKFFSEIGIDVRYSDMSFAFYSEKQRFSYSGRTFFSLFSDKRNLINPKFYKLLFEIGRFSKNALNDLQKKTQLSFDVKLKDYLASYNYSNNLIYNYILPMGAAIWSTSSDKMLEFPAISLINFFKNHGLLSFKDRPKWQTVVGSSSSYVTKFKERFSGKITLNSNISSIAEEKSTNQNRFKLLGEDSDEVYDHVIFAIHADQVLPLLGDFKQNYLDIFSIWKYSNNSVVLHSDLSAMPRNKACWASWNYLEHSEYQDKLYLSYYMNLLMGLKSNNHYIVTLNCPFQINQDKILYSVNYHHPLYTTESLKTQKQIKEINGNMGLWFCGSYLGYGFHEDAAVSALELVTKLKFLES